MVEAITRQIQDNPRDFVEYSAKKWRKITGISTKKYRKLLSFLEENGKILLENSEKSEKKYLKVSIPKLLEIADEYTKKRLRGGKEKSENIRTKSVTTPSNVSLEKRREDKRREEKPKTTKSTSPLDEITNTYQKKFPEVRKLWGLAGIIRAREFFDGCLEVGWTKDDILNAIKKATSSKPWEIISVDEKIKSSYAKEWDLRVKEKAKETAKLRNVLYKRNRSPP